VRYAATRSAVTGLPVIIDTRTGRVVECEAPATEQDAQEVARRYNDTYRVLLAITLEVTPTM
jgi:hypothetical protein